MSTSTTSHHKAPLTSSPSFISERTIASDAESTHVTSEAPWFTENYFTTKHPATVLKRKIYIKILVLMCSMLIVFLMGVLSIYWGSLWKTTTHARGLNGWVVDNDGGEIGRFVTEAFQNATGPSNQLNWQFHAPRSNASADLIDDLVDEKTWVIVTISSGASSALSAAAANANASYNGSSAITVYASEARNENAYRIMIRPQVQAILEAASEKFALQFVRQLEGSGVNVGHVTTNAPGILTRPISYTIDNVRPFDVPVANAVSFVGLIYLLVLAFFVTMVHYSARVDVTRLEDHLTFVSLIVIRILNPIIIYFFVSLFYSLVSLAFLAPFGRVFSHSGFVIYWMMCWMAMCALGFAIEAVITVLTPRFIPFFFLLWIIANVSVCLYPLQALPGIYRYGYAMPFYNVSRTVRAILFNTKNNIGLNFGVQFAWTALSIVCIVVLQYVKRQQALAARETALVSAVLAEKSV